MTTTHFAWMSHQIHASPGAFDASCTQNKKFARKLYFVTAHEPISHRSGGCLFLGCQLKCSAFDEYSMHDHFCVLHRLRHRLLAISHLHTIRCRAVPCLSPVLLCSVYERAHREHIENSLVLNCQCQCQVQSRAHINRPQLCTHTRYYTLESI